MGRKLSALAVCIIMLLTGCDLFTSGGRIILELSGSGRSIWNPEISMNIDSYTITLTQGDETLTIPGHRDNTFVMDAISPGFWEIDVQGFNSDEQLIAVLDEPLMFFVRRGQVVAKTVTLHPRSMEGEDILTGNLEFSLDRTQVSSAFIPSKPVLSMTVKNINYRFSGYAEISHTQGIPVYREADDNPFTDPFSFVFIEGEVPGDETSQFMVATFGVHGAVVIDELEPLTRIRMEGLPVGWYEVTLELKHQEQALWKNIYFARIAEGDTKTAVNLTNLQIALGAMGVDVIADLQDPIDGVSFTGNASASLDENHSVTLEYEAENDYGLYQWYVNGDAAGTDKQLEYEFSAEGVYVITLLVFDDGYWGSHSLVVEINEFVD